MLYVLNRMHGVVYLWLNNLHGWKQKQQKYLTDVRLIFLGLLILYITRIATYKFNVSLN